MEAKPADDVPCSRVLSTERGTRGTLSPPLSAGLAQVPLGGGREGRRESVWGQSVPGRGATGRRGSKSLVCREKFAGEEDETIERMKRPGLWGTGARCHPVGGREPLAASWVIARPPPAPRALGLRMESDCQGRGQRVTSWSPPGRAGT